MELKDTVTLFSTEVFSDTFDPLITFLGKVNPFAEITNSGTSSQRRILETPTTEIIPSERVIEDYTGKKFLVADQNPDYWNSEIIRFKYSTLPVTTMGSVGDIGETLAAAQADQQVYVYPYFVRREVDEKEESDYLSGYELYFSKTKFFSRGVIGKFGSAYYRLKTDTWLDGAGFAIAQAVKLESPLQTFDVKSNSSNYDPATDTYTPLTVPDIACFVEPLVQDYDFISPSFNSIEVGDLAISVLKSAVALEAGDFIGDNRILSVRDLGDWVTCHCRYLS